MGYDDISCSKARKLIHYQRNFKVKMNKITVAIFVLYLMGSSVLAQEKENSNWHYLTDVYLMLPTTSGDVGVAELPPLEVDAGAGNIFSHLKMGTMLYLEATNDDWSITSDLLYMKLGQGVVPSN